MQRTIRLKCRRRHVDVVFRGVVSRGKIPREGQHEKEREMHASDNQYKWQIVFHKVLQLRIHYEAQLSDSAKTRPHATAIQPMHLRRGKEAPGTRRSAWIDFLVNCEPDSGSDHAGSEVIDQLLKSQHLFPSRPGQFKVANETDSNPHRVDLFSIHMATLDLPEPTWANFYLPITRVDPVANHKVIRQSVLHPALPMRPAVDGGVALPDGAVMRHNPLPSVRTNPKPGCHSPDVPGKPDGGRLRRLGQGI
jgi:hypothetical protein